MENPGTVTLKQDNYLPISMLNQLEYCERRFYLIHVLGEMEINAHVLEGTLRHEQAHTGATERMAEKIVHRRVYVWSDALQIAGYADIVEEFEEKAGVVIMAPSAIVPVEYKKGRMGRWLNDHVQLCAQAMCLEERLGKTIEKGGLFYFGSRRRQEVIFAPELRQRTIQAVERARELINRNHLPFPLSQVSKCRDCSLEPICLPQEMLHLYGSAKTER